MKLRERAFGLLARREHSQQELKQKLLRKGYASAEIHSLLVNLAREGLQSDERYTEAYVRLRIDAGFGPRRIRSELQQRGISDSLINKHLHRDEAFWWSVLSSVWQKKYDTKQLQTKELKEHMKQVRFLTQRGFELSMIYKLLGEL